MSSSVEVPYKRELIPTNENLQHLIQNLSFDEHRCDSAKRHYVVEAESVEHSIALHYSTNCICDKWFNSRREGMKIIREAEKAGYIRRDRIHIRGDIDRRGVCFTKHSLTRKGKQVKDRLRKERESK